MKKLSISEIGLLAMIGIVGVTIISTLIGMSKTPTNEINVVLRSKLIDMIQMIAGGVMTILSALIIQKKDTEK